MKFQVLKELLLNRLSDMISIVDNKSPHPILGHVYLEARDGVLRLIATDTEITLSSTITASIAAEGAITVACDKFHQVVQRMPDQAIVSCTFEDEQFFIQSGNAKMKLATLPAADFPVAQNSEQTTSLTVDGGDLFNILSKVRFSMAKNDVRHYLNGIYLNTVEGQRIEAAGTDGHRLSCAFANLSETQNHKVGFILPEKAANALIKQLNIDTQINEINLNKQVAKDVETINQLDDQIRTLRDAKKFLSREQSKHVSRPVTLQFNDRELSLDTGSHHLITRLIDGKYPDYEQIIPERLESPVLIDRKALLGALRRSQVLLSNNDNGILLRFEGHQVYLSARNMQNETADEKIDIVNPQVMQVEIGLNVSYLIDATSNLEGDTIQMHFEDANRPVLITSQTDPEVRYVIMPMRI